MKLLETESDLIGKTITATDVIDDKWYVVFSDQTYAIISSGPSYDGERSEPELSSDESLERMDEWKMRMLRKLGVLNEADEQTWTTSRATRDSLDQQQKEARERVEYERLKKKYASS